MKNILKTKYISFLLALVMVVGIFLPCGGALADGGKYSIDIGIKINEKDKLIKEVKEGGIIKSSGRQVKVYKLKADKGMTDKEMFDLAQSLHKSGEKEVSIKEAEDKLKEKKLFDKDGVLSEKSKLVYDGKFVDEIKLNKGDDPDLTKLTEENITIKDLEEGYYLIKETDESKKIANKAINTFVIHVSDKTVKGVNGKKVYRIEAKETMPTPTDSLKLIKVDADNKDIRINKTQFALYKKSKDGKKDELVKVTGEKGKYFYNEEKGATIPLETWDKGELTVENLPEGTYYFKETKPAENYDFKGNTNINKESDKVEPGKTVTVTNSRPPIIKKIDDKTGETLYNAKFKLYGKDDKPVKFNIKDNTYYYDPNGKEEMVATSRQGSIYIKDLPNGTYYFKEIEAPEGYKIEDKNKKYSFDYKDGQMKAHESKESNYLVIGNPKIHTDKNPKTPRGGFNFVKIDSTKDENRLGGAKFILMKKVGSNFEKYLVNGKEVKLTSKDNGEFAIDGLEYGEYALKEVEAPKNHTIINDLTPFTVDAASSSLPAKKIVNEPYTPKTIVSKTNTITTKYTPSDVTRIVKTPLVKTGDIRIVVMAIVGLILLMMGIKLVNSTERMQRI